MQRFVVAAAGRGKGCGYEFTVTVEVHGREYQTNVHNNCRPRGQLQLDYIVRFLGLVVKDPVACPVSA